MKARCGIGVDQKSGERGQLTFSGNAFGIAFQVLLVSPLVTVYAGSPTRQPRWAALVISEKLLSSNGFIVRCRS